jgi:hypothetical protein
MMAAMEATHDTAGEFSNICLRLEKEAREETEKASAHEVAHRVFAMGLVTAAAALSAAGSAAVFGDATVLGGFLAGAGALAAAVNVALKPAERQADQLRRRADFAAVADQIELLRRVRAERLTPEERDAELANLINRLSEIRASWRA